MTKSHPAKKVPAGLSGARTLITAASLAITLGGWAGFTRANIDTADPASSAPAIAIPLGRPSTDLKLAPQLLPTIVPAPAPAPRLAIAHAPVIPADLLSDSAPVAARAAAPAPQAAAPEPPVGAQLPAVPPLPEVNAPPLRSVSAPPQPIARTRSSK